VVTGTPTTTVPAGSLIHVTSTGKQFEIFQDVDILALDAWASGTLYSADEPADRVTNNGNAYVCITSGTSAGSGGPTTEDEDITDNAAHWRFMGPGTGAVDVIAQATVTGPVLAASGDLSSIDSQGGGWDGVINLLDATPGRDVMSDADLRILRGIELTAPGTSPQAAIRAALFNLANVTAVTVFVNNTDETNGDGMPPHSVEALVEGGADQDIWNALLANVAAGIRTWGGEIGTATDAQGTDHEERFSRAELIDIYVDVTVVKDPSTYPTDGDDQIRLAIATWGNGQPDGRDVVASAIVARVFTVNGVLDATVLIDDAPSPVTGVTIPVNLRQRAVYDTSRIDVASSDGVP
jgi:hypothetical protein